MGERSLRIRVPCPKRWEDLAPSENGRYCAACGHEVLDAARRTRAELDRRLDAGERVCAQLTLLPDGSVLTRDHPRAGAWAVAVAAAALACAPPSEPVEPAPARSLESEQFILGQVVLEDAGNVTAEGPSEEQLERLRQLIGYVSPD